VGVVALRRGVEVSLGALVLALSIIDFVTTSFASIDDQHRRSQIRDRPST